MSPGAWATFWTDAAGGRPAAVRWSDDPSPVPAKSWSGPLDCADIELLARICGPAIDLGCGPGRFVAAMRARGLDALGVDVSAQAIQLARSRGGTAVTRCLFDPLPGEGSWEHALLVDGNIGIGADPVRLLRRAFELLTPGGSVHVELDPPNTCSGPVLLHLESADSVREPLHWARVSASGFAALAGQAGLTVREIWHRADRWFAHAIRPSTTEPDPVAV